ncbi:MAG: hypothetical protein M3441_25800, partial [Chloroflexota bacterium]|nr:hypothetical protein [Chloroflexota bacterium]
MPLWRCTVEKFSGFFGEFWVNQYWIDAPNLSDAGLVRDQIVAAERPILITPIQITKARVDDAVVGTDVFDTKIFNQAGTRAQGSSSLPLWVTARVDFSALGGGRPSRKYWRGFLMEDDIVGMQIAAGSLVPLQTYATA